MDLNPTYQGKAKIVAFLQERRKTERLQRGHKTYTGLISDRLDRSLESLWTIEFEGKLKAYLHLAQTANVLSHPEALSQDITDKEIRGEVEKEFTRFARKVSGVEYDVEWIQGDEGQRYMQGMSRAFIRTLRGDLEQRWNTLRLPVKELAEWFKTLGKEIKKANDLRFAGKQGEELEHLANELISHYTPPVEQSVENTSKLIHLHNSAKNDEKIKQLRQSLRNYQEELSTWERPMLSPADIKEAAKYEIERLEQRCDEENIKKGSWSDTLEGHLLAYTAFRLTLDNEENKQDAHQQHVLLLQGKVQEARMLVSQHPIDNLLTALTNAYDKGELTDDEHIVLRDHLKQILGKRVLIEPTEDRALRELILADYNLDEGLQHKIAKRATNDEITRVTETLTRTLGSRVAGAIMQRNQQIFRYAQNDLDRYVSLFMRLEREASATGIQSLSPLQHPEEFASLDALRNGMETMERTVHQSSQYVSTRTLVKNELKKKLEQKGKDGETILAVVNSGLIRRGFVGHHKVSLENLMRNVHRSHPDIEPGRVNRAVNYLVKEGVISAVKGLSVTKHMGEIQDSDLVELVHFVLHEENGRYH